MTPRQRFIKRAFDIVLSFLGLAVIWPLLLILIVLARRDTGRSGLFKQKRLGRHAKPFTVFKIRTMKSDGGSTITAVNDERITKLGNKLRRWKLDELPQLLNVLRGDMSFVGPRPDVHGYLDHTGPEWASVLDLRPGITGPATLHYRKEEVLLASVGDAKIHNDTVIWPHKLELNRDYAMNWSFSKDIGYIVRTILQ